MEVVKLLILILKIKHEGPVHCPSRSEQEQAAHSLQLIRSPHLTHFQV